MARQSRFSQSGVAMAAPEAIKPTRTWSAQQEKIFEWFAHPTVSSRPDGSGFLDPDNLVVKARAGTGKTTTIVEGVNRAPETDICLTAFSKKIADELNNRITNEHAVAKTLHGIGYEAIRLAWKYIKVDDQARGKYLTAQVLTPPDAKRNPTPHAIFNLVTRLHGKARDMFGAIVDEQAIINLAIRFDLLPDEGWVDWPIERIAKAVVEILQWAADEKDPPRHIGIDYADMIFLPLVKGWLQPRFDLVVVDEAQDMTLAQLQIAQRICKGRICVVGDDKQAIYGFRGADSGSLGRLKNELQAVELPLTITYRCGQKIVEYARTLVPDFEAGPQNPSGSIETRATRELLELARPGDFVLSRLNAPLVGTTLAFLRKGVRARMAGRDIGKGLAAIVEKRLHCSRSTKMADMLKKLDEWKRKTVAKYAAYGRQDQMQVVEDQAETIAALAVDHDTVGQLLDSCAYLFEDGKRDDTIVCSTVHKAKGLEADRVFILRDTLYRRGRTVEEEAIEYVAVTRAKTTLVWVEQGGALA